MFGIDENQTRYLRSTGILNDVEVLLLQWALQESQRCCSIPLKVGPLAIEDGYYELDKHSTELPVLHWQGSSFLQSLL